MKKTLLSVAAVSLFVATLVSCEATKTSESTTDTTVVNGDTSVKKTTTTTVKADVPTFSSDEVNKGLVEYATLKDEYLTALKNNNKAQVEALTSKYTAWAQGAATWNSKLKADEIQKYSEYLTKLSNDWGAAAQEAVK